MFSSSDSNPVLINNDSGEIMNCFFNINERYMEYNNLKLQRQRMKQGYQNGPK